jgi:hypothetical protein
MKSDVFGGNLEEEGRDADVAFVGQCLQSVFQFVGQDELYIELSFGWMVIMGHCWVKSGLYL